MGGLLAAQPAHLAALDPQPAVGKGLQVVGAVPSGELLQPTKENRVLSNWGNSNG